MKIKKITLFFLILILNCLQAVYDFTTINVGGFYKLAANVSDQITISSSNVTLDLNGHTITGGTNGIVINSNLSNVTIKNGTIDAVTLDGVQINSGCSDILLSNLVVKQALVGIDFDTSINSNVRNCDMSLNTTGLQLDTCANIIVRECTARANTQAGYDLLSSTTCSLFHCKAVSTGNGNSNTSADIIGFSAANGRGNVFEECIANSTQGLQVTAYDSVIAGFALRSSESCSKIIECEASNSTSSPYGSAIPYGIRLVGQLDTLTSVTGLDLGSATNTIRAGRWSPDGQYFAIAGTITDTAEDVRLYKFDRVVGTLIELQRIPSGATGDIVAWSPDGAYLAIGGAFSTSDDFIIFSFDRINERLEQIASGGNLGEVLTIDWSPDEQHIVITGILTGTDDLILYQFDRVSHTLTQVDTKPLNASTWAARWHPSGRYISVGTSTSSDLLILYAFDETTQTLIELDSHSLSGGGTRNAMDWTCDGNYLAIGGDLTLPTTSDVQIWRLDEQSDTLSYITGAASGTVYSTHWAADGVHLAVSGSLGTNDVAIYLFDRLAGSLTLAQEVAIAGTVYSTRWSPDGQYLAIAGSLTTPADVDVEIYTGLSFPEKNLIMNNKVYCNSGAADGLGFGISGSSIANLIIGNTAYDNPCNYGFVTNVFNQQFGQGPTLLQNLEVDTNAPINTPMDIPAQVQRVNLLLESLVDNLL